MCGAKVSKLIAQAASLQRRGQLHQALGRLRRACAFAPRNPQVIHGLGVLCGQLGRYSESIGYLVDVVNREPNNFMFHYNLGNVLYEMKRYSEALESYDRAISLNPNFVGGYNNRGNTLKELHCHDEALICFDKVIAFRPSSADAHYNRGNVLIEIMRYEDALGSLDRAISLKPDFAEAYNARGIALRYLNRHEESLANCNWAISLKPEFSEAHCNQGIVLASLRRYEAALVAYDNALSIKADCVIAYINRGDSLVCLGKVDAAVASLKKAVDIDPGSAQAHFGLGKALMNQGRVEEAVSHYKQAREIAPNSPGIHNMLGEALALLGKGDEAAASFYQALQEEPDAETYFYLHSLLLDPADMLPAIQCVETAVKLQPLNVTYKVFLGILLEYVGRAADADIYFKDAQQGSNIDRARVDSWNYIKSVNKKIPRMIGLSSEAFRIGIEGATLSGLVLELGVRYGASIRQIASLTSQQVYGFDSFKGLPEAWRDEAEGSYSTNGLIPEVPDNVQLYEGWFDDTLPEFARTHNDPIRFMNIDCDLYSSTKIILDCLSSKIIPGTVIVFDEYLGNESWRNDEFKAFQEAVMAYGWNYEYLAFSIFTKQVVIRIL